MKRVLLIFGNPGQGKSTLAKTLEKKHGFHHLSVDETYVEFIQSKCPEVYFPKLRLFIAQHFHAILESPYTKQSLDRDYVSEWHDHLMELVAEMSNRHDHLAVEGYLLKSCLNGLEARMRTLARVFAIEATSRTYRVLNMQISVEEIAALGLEGGGQ